MPVSDNTEWTECEITVPRKYFSHETEGAVCFLLWDKKRMNFPRQKDWCKIDMLSDDENYIIKIPKWFVEKHGLKYMMDKEIRELIFPKKTKQPKAAPLFEAVEIEAEISETAQPIQSSPLPDWLK